MLLEFQPGQKHTALMRGVGVFEFEVREVHGNKIKVYSRGKERRWSYQNAARAVSAYESLCGARHTSLLPAYGV